MHAFSEMDPNDHSNFLSEARVRCFRAYSGTDPKILRKTIVIFRCKLKIRAKTGRKYIINNKIINKRGSFLRERKSLEITCLKERYT